MLDPPPPFLPFIIACFAQLLHQSTPGRASTLQLDLVSVVEALAELGPTAMGKALAKHKGAIVISLPRAANRPAIKASGTRGVTLYIRSCDSVH